MFPFQKNRKRLEDTVALITSAGYEVSTWFKDEEYLQWEHSRLWTAFCGTIPAFAFVITHELLKNRPPTLKVAQRAFVRVTEDALFSIYRKYSEGHMVRIGDCLPLASERFEVCRMLGTSADTFVTMDMILGIIFPGRLQKYQMDWAAGFASTRPDAPTTYPAMRLAADLSGVVTPDSLVEHTAMGLGITGYGYALSPLLEFGAVYIQKNSKS